MYSTENVFNDNFIYLTPKNRSNNRLKVGYHFCYEYLSLYYLNIIPVKIYTLQEVHILLYNLYRNNK